MIPQIRFRHGIEDGSRPIVDQSCNVDRRDERILRRIQRWHVLGSLHQLLRHRIIVSVITIPDVLLGQRIVRIGGTFVSRMERFVNVKIFLCAIDWSSYGKLFRRSIIKID